MLKRVTLLSLVLCLAFATSAYSNKRVNQDFNFSSTFDVRPESAMVVPTDQAHLYLSSGGAISPVESAYQKNKMPDVIMAAPIQETMLMSTRFDPPETRTFTLPNREEPDNPDAPPVFITLADRPQWSEETAKQANLNLGFMPIGHVQFVPAANSKDPNSTIRLDSMAFTMLRPGDADAEPLKHDWWFIPMYFNDNNKNVNIFESDRGTVRQMEWDFELDLVTTEANGGAGFYTISQEEINDALEFDARGELVAINSIVLDFTNGGEGSDLILPGDRPLVFVFVPENFTDDDAHNEGETNRILAAWEFVFQETPHWSLGGWFKRSIDVNAPGIQYLPNTERVEKVWPTLSWALDADLYPEVAGRDIRQNYDINFAGEYQGEDNVDRWPWGGSILEPNRLSDVGVRPDESGQVSGFAVGASYPNPAGGVANIPFSIDRPGAVTLRVSNMLGEVVFETREPMMDAGSYVWDVDTKGIAEGSYIFTMSSGDKTVSNKMMVTR